MELSNHFISIKKSSILFSTTKPPFSTTKPPFSTKAPTKPFD
jgi:DNA mismatch repair protein MutS2